VVAAGGTASALWSGKQQPSAAPEEQVTQPVEVEEPATTTPPTRTPEQRVSRDQDRPELDPEVETQAGDAFEAEPIATEPRFLTEDLNLWTGPGEDTDLLTVLDFGSKVQVTGRVVDGYAQIVHNDKLRWVNAEYLSKTKPKPEDTSGGDTGGLSTAACASGSDVESGLVENAIAVHRAVCAEFPEITSYYGLRPGDDGEHGTGQAIDIMITDSATGDAVAEFVQDNYSALGVSEIIWSQQIWTVERSSEGWRWMEDRGSDTANHYDHVHVTVY
jgi:SH3 domain-containing protein